MTSLLEQIKRLRLSLGLKQNDMLLRVGISRQQYQRIEAKGNPRLDTLELIATGLNSQLMLIPKEKLAEVIAILERDTSATAGGKNNGPGEENIFADDPWQDVLGKDQ